MTSVPSQQPSDTVKKNSAISNLSVRLITALALLPVVLWGAYSGGWLMTIMAGVVALIGALEFYIFARGREVQGSALIGAPMVVAVIIAFHFRENSLWITALAVGALLTLILETARHPNDLRRSLWQVGTTLAGVIYVAFPIAFLIVIRAIEPDSRGLMWFLMVCLTTWGTDTMAYVGGRFFGKRKLAPVLSPKKTVEGAIVGVIGGIVPSFILLVLSGERSLATVILVSLAPIVAIFGDLFESALKRFFRVKDSHIQGFNIFPGHGGVLDRIDSIIWVSTLYYIFLVAHGVIVW